MKLKAAINGQIYDIVEGATFAEEHSETLDSGTIIIDKVSKFDLRPYDDVFIFDADEDRYGGWGLHFQGTISKDLQEGAEFRYRNQTIIIGQNPGIPPTPIIQFVTAIDLYDPSISSLVDRMTGEWHARISCDVFWVEQQGGYPLPSSGRMSSLYKVTYSQTKLTFEKISDAIGAQAPGPQTFEMPLRMSGSNFGYFTMGNLAETGYPAVYFENPTFTSSMSILYGDAVNYVGFHKHMLVDQFEATCINITSQTYKYKIDLFSETKKLEKIVLPNIALTQPIELTDRKSVWEYINHFVEQYSPKVKIGIPSPYEGAKGFWINSRKYSVDPTLQSVFESVYAPEMQMNQPTLRDVLTQLMLTKDRIPYVEDDVIKAMDLSSTVGDFAYSDDDTTQIVTSMSSSNYATGLKRQFDNALAQKRTCKRVEYLGFRNSDQGLLTLQNLRLEFSYPIYKIDKMLLCYWKKMEIIPEGGGAVEGYRWFLCKQDITPLILQNQKRNILSVDWTVFPTTQQQIPTEEMANYRLYTIGYDIGSREITGWSEIYSYPDETHGWWIDQTKSYIENILCILDAKNPYGIYHEGWELVEAQLPPGKKGAPVHIMLKGANHDTYPQSPYSQTSDGSSLWIKGLIFQVEYQAFYNGATYADKDDDRDDIISPDNPSSSLTVLEKDGIFQEAKANRFGNEATQINCRYSDPSEMQPLASVFDGDKVVFRREYAIFRNLTITAYSATKGYILKNYFTSVFAQLRPFPLAGYDQSVNRADIERSYIFLSKTRKTVDPPKVEMSDKVPLSPFSPTPAPSSIGDIKNPTAINYQTMEKNGNAYASDVNVFVNGHSLCISFQMRDNLGMGNYIRNAKPFGSSIYQNAIGWGTEEWKTGSEQDWWSVVDDVETGELNSEVEFKAYNIEEEPQALVTASDVDDKYEDDYFQLPKTSKSGKTIATLKTNLRKDQKEVIGETIQLEYQTDKGIAISEMMPTLNDAIGIKNKWPTDTTVENAVVSQGNVEIYAFSFGGSEQNGQNIGSRMFVWTPCLVIGIPDTVTSAQNTKVMIENGISVSWGTTYRKRDFIAMVSAETVSNPATRSLDISNIRILSVEPDGINVQFDVTTIDWQALLFVAWDNKPKHYQVVAKMPLSSMFSKTGWKYYETGHGIYGTIIKDSPNTSVQATTVLNDAVNGVVHDVNPVYPSNPMSGSIVTMSGVQVTYGQNQFVVYSQESVKKERVYDEFPSIDASNEEFTDVFSVFDDQITINLANAPEGTKSVQYWYLDQESGAYRFVFGVDVTKEDINRGSAVVYASMVDSKDRRVFDPNMNKLGECVNAALEIALSQGRFYN